MYFRHDDKIKVFLKQSVFHFGSAKCRRFLNEYGALASVNNFSNIILYALGSAHENLASESNLFQSHSESRMVEPFQIEIGVPN